MDKPGKYFWSYFDASVTRFIRLNILEQRSQTFFIQLSPTAELQLNDMY